MQSELPLDVKQASKQASTDGNRIKPGFAGNNIYIYIYIYIYISADLVKVTGVLLKTPSLPFPGSQNLDTRRLPERAGGLEFLQERDLFCMFDFS